MKNTINAVYWNAFYPGHIHLPANTAYPCKIDDLNCMVNIVRHHNPVVVTDFGNNFVLSVQGEEKHIHLQRPISQHPTNTISVDFKAKGNSETQHAVWTKEHLYAAYRTQSFTEITIGIELYNSNADRLEDLSIFYKALDRILELYAVAARDPKAIPTGELQRNQLIVRRCAITYEQDDKKSAMDRLRSSIPPQFEFKQFSYLEFAETAARLSIDEWNLARTIGHHMAVGTQISPAQKALIRCFQLLHVHKDFRYAIIDAFSIIEVEIFDLIRHASETDKKVATRFEQIRQKSGRVTIKQAINTFLPYILRQRLQSHRNLIGDLDRARKLRHALIHEREYSSSDDAISTINAAQLLISVLEEFHLDAGINIPTTQTTTTT